MWSSPNPLPRTGAAVRLACALRRVPYVYYCADIVSDAAALAGVARPVVRAVAGLESFALRGARRVVAVSDGVAGRARDLGAADVAVVPNGVRVPEAVAAGVPEGFPTCGGPVFVYAGTVAHWLAPEVFIDAFERARERLGDARLVFVGQGSGWEDLAERARRVAGVELIPAVSAEEADRWMARASATLASLRPGGYDYAYPTKILASLAQGTPVIYAGPGQAGRDVREAGLGAACGLDADRVAEAMVAVASGTLNWVGEEAGAGMGARASLGLGFLACGGCGGSFGALRGFDRGWGRGFLLFGDCPCLVSESATLSFRFMSVCACNYFHVYSYNISN